MLAQQMELFKGGGGAFLMETWVLFCFHYTFELFSPLFIKGDLLNDDTCSSRPSDRSQTLKEQRQFRTQRVLSWLIYLFRAALNLLAVKESSLTEHRFSCESNNSPQHPHTHHPPSPSASASTPTLERDQDVFYWSGYQTIYVVVLMFTFYIWSVFQCFCMSSINVNYRHKEESVSSFPPCCMLSCKLKPISTT